MSGDRWIISERNYHRIAIVALFLLCTIVITGAAVRLTGSGLGCSDWPNCETDTLVSVSNTHQAIEQLNRLFTGAVSIGVIAAVLGAYRRRPRSRRLVRLAWGLVVGVIAQILLGGVTVLTELNPIAVGSHFGVSMVLVAVGTLLVFESGNGVKSGSVGSEIEPEAARFLPLSWAMVVAGVAVLGLTGPMVTGAGPHAGDEEARRLAISIPDAARIHSASAWLFLALIVGVVVGLTRASATRSLTRSYPLVIAVVIQGAIGYLQYNRGIPTNLVILHIAGATAICIALTWFQIGLLHQSGRLGRALELP